MSTGTVHKVLSINTWYLAFSENVFLRSHSTTLHRRRLKEEGVAEIVFPKIKCITLMWLLAWSSGCQGLSEIIAFSKARKWPHTQSLGALPGERLLLAGDLIRKPPLRNAPGFTLACLWRTASYQEWGCCRLTRFYLDSEMNSAVQSLTQRSLGFRLFKERENS